MAKRADLGAMVHKTGTHAAGMMNNLESALKSLEREIASDKSGLIDMTNHLRHLKMEKERLEHEIEEMEHYCNSMVSEEGIGKVLKQFDGMETYLQNAYGRVREKHADGIKMLEREFGYHPAYKRGLENEFTSSYFTPVADPNNPKRPAGVKIGNESKKAGHS